MRRWCGICSGVVTHVQSNADDVARQTYSDLHHFMETQRGTAIPVGVPWQLPCGCKLTRPEVRTLFDALCRIVVLGDLWCSIRKKDAVCVQEIGTNATAILTLADLVMAAIYHPGLNDICAASPPRSLAASPAASPKRHSCRHSTFANPEKSTQPSCTTVCGRASTNSYHDGGACNTPRSASKPSGAAHVKEAPLVASPQSPKARVLFSTPAAQRTHIAALPRPSVPSSPATCLKKRRLNNLVASYYPSTSASGVTTAASNRHVPH